MKPAPATVLVTGGTGFIGLNLIEALLENGLGAISFDARPPHERAKAFFGAHPRFLGWWEGDIRDAGALKSALAESSADSMIHAAAITAGPSRERREPATIASVNLGGTVAAVTEAAEAKLRRFIFVSTAAVFGVTAEKVPILDEDSPKRPATLYAITKSAAEDTALRIGALHALPVHVARLGWIFGRWEHDTGVRDTLSNIYEATHAAKAGQPYRTVEDPPRDWTPAPAISAAVVRLLLAETPRHKIYNLGTGRVWRVSDWALALENRLGHPVRVVCEVSGSGAPPAGLMSGDRFAAEFGPVGTSSLEEDVAAYLAWLDSGNAKGTE
jgi:nucleoside-diphosphate-sugar epimerase